MQENTPSKRDIEVNDLLRTILEAVYTTEAALYGISRIDQMGFPEEDSVQERIADILTSAGIKSNASIMTAIDEFEEVSGIKADLQAYRSRGVQS